MNAVKRGTSNDDQKSDRRFTASAVTALNGARSTAFAFLRRKTFFSFCLGRVET